MRAWFAAVTVLVAMTVSAWRVLGGGRAPIRDLVAGGTPVDTTGEDGLTMLQLAVLENRPVAVRRCWSWAADPDAQSTAGQTPLMQAASMPACGPPSTS